MLKTVEKYDKNKEKWRKKVKNTKEGKYLKYD